MKVYSDFPRYKIRRLFPLEFQVFESAVGKIKGTMYYAFKNNMTTLAGTKYKNVTWVARHILIEFVGETTLKNLRSFGPTCKNIDAVRAIVEEYRAKLAPTEDAAPPTEEEAKKFTALTVALSDIKLTQVQTALPLR